MAIRIYKPCTPGTRNRSILQVPELSQVKPQKRLLAKKSCATGRNNRGVITSRHSGGGHKRRYRIVDFKRSKQDSSAVLSTIEYDPNRSAFISLLKYEDGHKEYILYPNKAKIGSKLEAGNNASIDIGNTLPLKAIPLGTFIHNIELNPGQGGKLVRSAGASAQLIAKDGGLITLKLPSGEVRFFRGECLATIGQVGNIDKNKVVVGKAGRKRWLGKRPHVRGVVMNPCDHPHGGGEGRSPIGRPRPLTPWGKVALGKKTRKTNKYSDMYIVRRAK